MLDQDYRLISQMKALRNVYTAVETSSRAVGKDIHNLSPSVKRIIASLRKQGLM